MLHAPADQFSPSPNAAPLQGLGERIRSARLSSGLSQEQLANLVGTTQSTVERIENGGAVRSKYRHEAAAVLGVVSLEIALPASAANSMRAASYLDQLPPEKHVGPLRSAANRLDRLADEYERWLNVYRLGSEHLCVGDERGDKELSAAADNMIAHAIRQMKRIRVEVCEWPALTLHDLGRKARIMRDDSSDFWEEQTDPVARSLCTDVLRLAGLAVPNVPDFTQEEIVGFFERKQGRAKP